MGNCKSALPGMVSMPARAGQRDFIGKYVPFLAAAPTLAARLRTAQVQKAIMAAGLQDDGTYRALARIVMAIWDETGRGALDHAALHSMTAAVLEALLCFDDSQFNVLAGATPEEIQAALTDLRNSLLRCAGLTQFTLEEHILIDVEAVAAWIEWLDVACAAPAGAAGTTASPLLPSPTEDVQTAAAVATVDNAAVAVAVPEAA